MGNSANVYCSECGYNKSFMTGIGMMYFNLESRMDFLSNLIKSKKTLNIVKKLIDERNGRLDCEHGHTVYLCPKCGEFHERFDYKIVYDGGVFQPRFSCENCKVILKKAKYSYDKNGYYDIDTSNCKCPKCGKAFTDDGFKIIIEEFWD